MLLSNSQMVALGSGSIISPGNFTASSRSPLDMKFSSPGSSKRYDNDGIGLGIVAALEKSGIMMNRYDISSKQNPVYYSGFSSNSPNTVQCARRFQFPVEIDDLSEEYTCVTSRDGITKVYYTEGEFIYCQNRWDGGDRHDKRWNKSMKIAVESPEEKVFMESPDFLSSCWLCKKKLQGKDIYMYKGEKGFCSKECRSVRIMEDDLNVNHKSTSTEVLSSPYAGGQNSSAGIFVI